MFSPEVGPRVESEAGEPASPKAPAVPTKLTIARGLKPSSRAKGTKIAAIMGTVEKEEPIPNVTSNPTSNIKKAPNALLLPISSAAAYTKVCTSPVVRMTSANPEAVIIIKPIMAIIFMPSVNKSSDSFHPTTPESENTTKPNKAPMIMESSHSCTAKATNTATAAAHKL